MLIWLVQQAMELYRQTPEISSASTLEVKEDDDDFSLKCQLQVLSLTFVSVVVAQHPISLRAGT